MPTVCVTVTVTETVTGARKAISISVDQDPVDISGKPDNVEVEIEWKLASSPGWGFIPTHRGVKIHAPTAKFKDKGGFDGWQKHRWVRSKNQRDGNDYKYTISVTDGKTTATWDPWIRN